MKFVNLLKDITQISKAMTVINFKEFKKFCFSTLEECEYFGELIPQFSYFEIFEDLEKSNIVDSDFFQKEIYKAIKKALYFYWNCPIATKLGYSYLWKIENYE